MRIDPIPPNGHGYALPSSPAASSYVNTSSRGSNVFHQYSFSRQEDIERRHFGGIAASRLFTKLRPKREGLRTATEEPPEDSVDIDEADVGGGDSDDEDEFDAGNALETAQGTGLTFEEAMNEDIDLLNEFLQGLRYQVQFRDQRMLNILEREGAWFFRLVRACLHKKLRGGEIPSASEKFNNQRLV